MKFKISDYLSQKPHGASLPPALHKTGAAAPVLNAGFTLIELLAVIAIMAILASLLWPGLSRSQALARKIQCASQLRQMDMAAQLYWSDNDGRAFRYRGAYTHNGDIYWFGWMERGPEGARKFDPTQAALFPYLSGARVEQCPAFARVSPDFKLKAATRSEGYGYNLCLSAPPAQPPLDAGSLGRPERTALFADAAQVNTFQAPASPDHPMLEEFYYIDASEATTHFRHAARANVAFCDGHVDSRPPQPGSLDSRMPGQRVGWLPAELLLP